MVHMSSGNYWGNGVYFSPNFLKSHWYSYMDSQYNQQMFISLVVLGFFVTAIL